MRKRKRMVLMVVGPTKTLMWSQLKFQILMTITILPTTTGTILAKSDLITTSTKTM